jgi:hypothetical protein
LGKLYMNCHSGGGQNPEFSLRHSREGGNPVGGIRGVDSRVKPENDIRNKPDNDVRRILGEIPCRFMFSVTLMK